MDKITLKELAPYLPYGVKGIITRWPQNKETVTLTGIKGELFYFGNQFQSVFTPLLRPLSDLTKPITHNGETVTVVNLIYEYCAEYVSRYGKNRKVFDNLANTQSIIEYIKPGGLSYTSFKVLLEYHFDVFGLIGRGLALPMEE